jgi:type IV pilus assembly protein PilB
VNHTYAIGRPQLYHRSPLGTRASPGLITMAVSLAATAERIGELLVQEGLVTREQLQKALADSRSTGGRVGITLVKLGFVQEADLTRMLARQFRMPAVDLSNFEPDQRIVKLVPPELATKHLLFPLAREGRTLTVAVADPLNMGVLEDLQFMTSYAIAPVLAGELSLKRLVEKYYESAGAQLESILADLAAEDTELELVESGDDESLGIEQMDEAPVVRMINAILIDAVRRGASDIHFECFEHEIRVRYRVDGALLEVMKPPVKLRAALISRFKIMAQLNISERRVPQDGRIKLKMGARVIDFRVSTLPTLFGEKVVLRILDKGNLTLDLETFGIEPRAERDLMDAVANPYGMVLVTGPTGSGKTTTLYSALSKINAIDTNIMTAEDPVEYNLFGINQVQVRADIGMSFAASLRAFLRQDPNVIMVGEVRDLETGSIAIKAALTGHLVLSTLHTNSAPETVTRLLDMGLEPFNVASALNLVLAQRLVRRLCTNCKEQYEPDAEELRSLKVTPSTTMGELRFTNEPLQAAALKASVEALALVEGITVDTTVAEIPFFKGRGCERCAGTGLKGRQGLYEVMVLTPAIRKLIMQNGDAADIRDVAVAEGMLTLRMDGWLKILKGLTTAEQVLRETAA